MDPMKLDVFQLSHELVLAVYEITRSFPPEEKFGLVSQMRRSASSVPTNIMEGSGRRKANDYIHFLSISRGSSEEIKYHFLLAKDLGYIEEKTYLEFFEKYTVVSKMLFRLIKSLESSREQKG